jgi:hypothetical protein
MSEDAWREQAHFWEARAALLAARVGVLEGALKVIAFASGDQPEAMNIPEADWYRSRFYGCVATASAALRTSEDEIERLRDALATLRQDGDMLK